MHHLSIWFALCRVTVSFSASYRFLLARSDGGDLFAGCICPLGFIGSWSGAKEAMRHYEEQASSCGGVTPVVTTLLALVSAIAVAAVAVAAGVCFAAAFSSAIFLALLLAIMLAVFFIVCW
jgi:hypothetical protein